MSSFSQWIQEITWARKDIIELLSCSFLITHYCLLSEFSASSGLIGKGSLSGLSVIVITTYLVLALSVSTQILCSWAISNIIHRWGGKEQPRSPMLISILHRPTGLYLENKNSKVKLLTIWRQWQFGSMDFFWERGPVFTLASASRYGASLNLGGSSHQPEGHRSLFWLPTIHKT